MKPMAWSLLASLLCISAAAAQDMRGNAGRSLFSDQKASRIGDAVTILVVEMSSASNDAQTSTSRESNLSAAVTGKVANASIPDVNASLGTGNEFKGQGATATHGSVEAKISAHVDSVLDNGNLVINGWRRIIINGEEQLIEISGTVRPSDIQPDNSVYSFNISDARIVFQGNGIVSRSQEPGWLTRFFHWLF